MDDRINEMRRKISVLRAEMLAWAYPARRNRLGAGDVYWKCRRLDPQARRLRPPPICSKWHFSMRAAGPTESACCFMAGRTTRPLGSALLSGCPAPGFEWLCRGCVVSVRLVSFQRRLVVTDARKPWPRMLST